MARGRHRVEPVRRPLPRPIVAAAAAGGGVLLVVSVGLAAAPIGRSPGVSVQAVVATAPGDAGTDADAATDEARLAEARDAREAREQARAGRDATRPEVTPTVGPSAPVAEPAAPAPAESSASSEPTTTAVVAPEPAPLPLPEPVPAVVGQLWVTTDVNVRSGPSPDDQRIGQLAALTQVDVTGATENGWTQTVTDGVAGWVKSSYLSESEPAPEPEVPVLSDASCPISAAIESGLSANALAVYRAVCGAFGDSVSSFGGYRRGDGGDHGSGRAVDIMVTGEPGWEIARYVQANAAELDVTYVIYQQRIWQAGNPASEWKWMEDRGSVTANHYDHVHVSVS